MYISVFLFCLYLVILVFDCIVMFEPFFWHVCIFWCPSPCIPFCLCLQWVYILDVVHKVLCWCGISSVDPALTAEVVLRLALVFESSAHMDEGKPSVYIILYHSYITTLSQWNGLAPTNYWVCYGRKGIRLLIYMYLCKLLAEVISDFALYLWGRGLSMFLHHMRGIMF